MRNCTEESFLKNVASHKIEILHDDEVYRHVRFAKHETNCYAFHLITGPGFLLYRGDMGCFEFERSYDMFEFFRCNEKELAYHKSKGRNMPINIGYWSEKLDAVDKDGGFKKFSYELFKSNVIEDFKSYAVDLSRQDRKELKDKIRDELFLDFDNGYEAHEATSNFQFFDSTGKEHHPFNDFWEHNNDDYTYHFVWACYAIVWGIQQYDNATLKELK